MDLLELEKHAERHGEWTMNVSKTQVLVCRFHRATNSDRAGWDDYSFYLNGERISASSADRLLMKAFEASMEAA